MCAGSVWMPSDLLDLPFVAGGPTAVLPTERLLLPPGTGQFNS